VGLAVFDALHGISFYEVIPFLSAPWGFHKKDYRGAYQAELFKKA